MTEKEKELFQGRIKKLQELRKAGIDPYPSKSNRTHTNKEAVDSFEKLSKNTISLVGRIRSMRDMGKISFANLEDETGKIQVLFKEGNLGNYKNVINQLDIGDFVEVGGALFKTKTGEKTVEAKDLKLLSKSLSALPEKWHGLADTETKLRKRYLDMIANPEVREMFRKKSVFWQTIREFLKEKGFLEVETPVLENVPGGAEAEPFVTHHKALDRDFFLRISLELPLKKLLVGGFERVFEIGRIFRNEGISTEHLQDYTQCEFYWAYADYEDLMSLLKEFYRKIVKDLFGTTKVKNQGVEVDWGKEWKRYDYYELFQKETGLDLNKADDKDLKALADKLKIKYEKFAQKGRLVDLIYKKTVRPKLVEPGFLLDPPVEVEPLAKRHPKGPNRVQRLQVMAWGTELGKGFTELNDPLDQRIRFEEQMKLREAGDKEAQMIDEDFIEALEYGMPPAAGFGLSERLFAVLMDKSIRETVIFPPMKQEK
ncbi:MAG: lysine--tRNA ligase [Candidatus Doudnabacteria bacterium]|nr:lysine--tRNA ligase [bacterium]MDZ4243516.1 lysine--tRNA ligase [Candidatus Doudnabacteria bacterium]